MAATSSSRLARSTSSWVLVSSRHSAARRCPPKALARSVRVSWTRRGDSKKIRVWASLASELSSRARSPLLRGRNPSKLKRSLARPDSASAVSTAEGPGATVTGTSASIAALTRRNPGSETEGIPASEIISTLEPPHAACSSCPERSRSLCSWKASSRPPIFTPRRWARFRARRVSSAATTSARARAAIRRGEASPRLPIGVAARVIVPRAGAYSVRSRPCAGPGAGTSGKPAAGAGPGAELAGSACSASLAWAGCSPSPAGADDAGSPSEPAAGASNSLAAGLGTS